MKTLFITWFMLASLAGVAQSKIVKDAKGNYSAVSHKDSTVSTPTGATFTDTKGLVYPLYKGSRGGLYYLRTSAKGTQYKVYIKASN